MGILTNLPTPITIAVVAIIIGVLSAYFNNKAIAVACATITFIAVGYFLLNEFHFI
jgi:hypothetical protein